VAVTVTVGAVGADPQAVSALMIMAVNRKWLILFMVFLLKEPYHTNY
jgi:hypothetical protein